MTEGKTQQRGPITDYFGKGSEITHVENAGAEDIEGVDRLGDAHVDRAVSQTGETGRLALCVCPHGKEWDEGEMWEPEGRACKSCCLEAHEWWQRRLEAA